MKPEIQTPAVPNFLLVSLTKNAESQKVPVHEFTEEQLREVAKKWTEDLIAKRKYRTTNGYSHR
jgi:hypothetical protein